VRRFALGWGRRFVRRSPQRWVIGASRTAWLDLVVPDDAAPLPPGSEPDVVIIPHTAAGRPPPYDHATDAACGLSALGRRGARAASGLLDVYRDGERAARPPLEEPAAPLSRPARPPLERTVVALGARTETLAAHLERLEGRLDRLQVDVRARHDAR
jgi:hypothetical protein